MIKNTSLASWKVAIHHCCLEMLQNKLTILKDEISLVQHSANEETKSAMGDKYETSRSMMQISASNMYKQQEQLVKQLSVLKRIKFEKKTDRIDLGSVVRLSNNQIYYLAVGLGQIELSGKSVIVVSPVSPIGKHLMGKEAGDPVNFEKIKLTIHEVS
jgi:transcription elongation GreA/GreB family factor